jgi:hypothetical protein
VKQDLVASRQACESLVPQVYRRFAQHCGSRLRRIDLFGARLDSLPKTLKERIENEGSNWNVSGEGHLNGKNPPPNKYRAGMTASRVYLFKESSLVRNSSATPFMLSGGSGVHYLSHGGLELTCFLKLVS